MSDRKVLGIADRWWARDFACGPDDLRPATTHVQEHAGTMLGNPGIWILVVGAAPLVSLPPGMMAALARRARRWSRSLVAEPAALAAELEGLDLERIVGPAFIGYGTDSTLKLDLAARGRALTSGDAGAVAELRAACSDEAWAHGGSDPRIVPTFGCFDEAGQLCALAGYKTWGGTIAHISIVSAPSRRGRGFASAAVACAARHALGAGLLPQYRTLMSNEPSMAVARKLGFASYGFSVFVRLRERTPSDRERVTSQGRRPG